MGSFHLLMSVNCGHELKPGGVQRLSVVEPRGDV